MSDFEVLPVVGTVESNRRWISEHMASAPPPMMEGGWESMFDAADATLAPTDGVAGETDALSMLDDPGEAGLTTDLSDALLPVEDGVLDIEEDGLDLGSLEALPADDLEGGFELDVLDDPSATSADPVNPAPSESSEILPPMPEFNPDQREAS